MTILRGRQSAFSHFHDKILSGSVKTNLLKFFVGLNLFSIYNTFYHYLLICTHVYTHTHALQDVVPYFNFYRKGD